MVEPQFVTPNSSCGHSSSSSSQNSRDIPYIDPPGSLMYIYVALACLLVLARSPAILVTAFSRRSRRLVRRPRLPIHMVFAPCMEGLRFGAPQAQTGRVMGMRNPQGPPIDPPGSLMYIYVALVCLLVLARSPAILVTAFSSRSRRLVRRPRLPIPPRPHARPGALDTATIPPLCSLRLYRDPGI